MPGDWWQLWVRKPKRLTTAAKVSSLREDITRIETTAETQRKSISKLRTDLRATRSLLLQTKTTCEDVRKLQVALQDMTAVIEELQKKRNFASQIKASKDQVAKFNDRLDHVDKVLRTMITGG